ncbi:MAG: hypothetical protein LQ350_002876 [Teloschistes chrysophthalmus]|nr:MAG: hypothetical protein LQ350_002876 [Niorma chrysophthalma]
MDSLPPPVLEALKFERSNYAAASVKEDSVYKVPKDTADAAPGTILKVEKDVDVSNFMIPSATALSRILYQSEDLTGKLVPASAFILWPYVPRSQPDGHAIVAWAHGTSSITGEGAPSNHKNLWQHFLGPYPLALQGYVVVAPDYAGLGVHEDATGEPITHQYLACPSHANDIIYAVKAAQQSFPELSQKFVVIGHSQGGGTAWAVAQRQAEKPAAGYLGAVAVSPVTTMLNQPEPFRSALATAICPGLAFVFPQFKPEDVLTEDGQRCLGIMTESATGIASSIAILFGAKLVKEDWAQNDYVQRYLAMISNGAKAIDGPLLVIHGEADETLNIDATNEAVARTVELFPSSSLEYIALPDVTHAPALQASQGIWMDWVADRFAGKEIKSGFQRRTVVRPRPAQSYQVPQSWYLERASQFFHAP